MGLTRHRAFLPRPPAARVTASQYIVSHLGKPDPSRSREGPLRNPTGRDAGRPAGGAPSPPCSLRLGHCRAGASQMRTSLGGRNRGKFALLGGSSSSGLCLVMPADPRTGSQGQPPQARPLVAMQALGSTLQMRKLRPLSYKWQIGLGLESSLPAFSLCQGGEVGGRAGSAQEAPVSLMNHLVSASGLIGAGPGLVDSKAAPAPGPCQKPWGPEPR